MNRFVVLALAGTLWVRAGAQAAAADPVQCPANGHWYEEVLSPTGTWAQALEAAQGRSWGGVSGHLATVTSQDENDCLASVVSGEPAWLGGYQDPTTSPPASDWHWITGEAWADPIWRPGEPNDYYGAGSESCLEWSSAGWNDVRCTETKPLLVEYEGVPETTTTTSTTSSTTSTSSTSTTSSTSSSLPPATSTSTTTSSSSTVAPTTTTLLVVGCNGIPDGATFSSVLCRMERLRDAVNASDALGKLQSKLAQTLDRGISRTADGRTLCGEGNLKKTRVRLRQARTAVVQYARRLKALPARRKIDRTVRLDFLAAGQAIEPDLKTLRGTVACPADAQP